jgi:ribosomal protein S18 acetylase RimI-like enzyme
VTFICEEGADLVGFAQIRLGAAPRCVEALKPGEVHRLYVVDECRGKGIAQSLMNACLDEFKRRDVDAVWLGVWERNPRAITFYRKFQFREAGEHVFQLGTDPQRDLIMVRQLTR